MEPFPACAHDKIRRISQHEIGHWMIARCLNFVPRDVMAKVVVASESSAISSKGRVIVEVMENLRSIKEARSYLERRIQILWAGIVAEALDPRSGIVNQTEAIRLADRSPSGSDAMFARQYTQLLANLQGNLGSENALNEVNRLSDDFWFRTIQVVEVNSPIILEVAEHLAYRIEVAGSGEEVIFRAADIAALPTVQQWFTEQTEIGKAAEAHTSVEYGITNIATSHTSGWPLNQ